MYGRDLAISCQSVECSISRSMVTSSASLSSSMISPLSNQSVFLSLCTIGTSPRAAVLSFLTLAHTENLITFMKSISFGLVFVAFILPSHWYWRHECRDLTQKIHSKLIFNWIERKLICTIFGIRNKEVLSQIVQKMFHNRLKLQSDDDLQCSSLSVSVPEAG